MCKNFSIRTDLAIEAKEMFAEDINGLHVITDNSDDVIVSSVNISSNLAAKKLNKNIGTYITVDISGCDKNTPCYRKKIVNILSSNIKKLLGNFGDKNNNVLVVGLGNWNITADALGPKVVSKINVTRHILVSSEKNCHGLNNKNNVPVISAISPGVLGITGIETSEISKGICEKISPDVVIVVDSLAARNVSRINSTIQLCDTGITPGAGMGNKRSRLDKKSLGCNVISIGVPTVIDAATLVSDTLDNFLAIMNKYHKYDGVEEKYSLISKLLNPYTQNMFVTPTEVDEVIEDLSSIIANAINISLRHI